MINKDKTPKIAHEKIEANQFFRLFQIFSKAHILNFFLFVAISSAIGGSGLLGHQTDGHCFVGQHGHYREVSKELYQFSRLYTIYTLVTMLITLIGTFARRNDDYLHIKLSLKEWLLATTVPLFWFITFLIVKYLLIE